jgi:hypothetical protein
VVQVPTNDPATLLALMLGMLALGWGVLRSRRGLLGE